MPKKKNVVAIVGSAGSNSANLKLVEKFVDLTEDIFDVFIFNDLKSLPHFEPELSTDNPPKQIVDFRNLVQNADGIIICTPEYVFSIPSGLKNAIEWCVSTTVFSDKPTGLITASSLGEKAHEELQLIMKTMSAKFTEETILLIQGVKSKFDGKGNFTDKAVENSLNNFKTAFTDLMKKK